RPDGGPLSFIQKTILIEVDRPPGSRGLPGLRKLNLGKLAVVIGIGRRDRLGERRQLELLAGVASGGPAVEVERIAGNRWRRFRLPGETTNRPEPFAIAH